MQKEKIKIKKRNVSIRNMLVAFVAIALFVAVAVGGFIAIGIDDLNIFLLVLIAVLWSVGSFLLLYYAMQKLTDVLPQKIARIITPFLFIAPLLILIGWGLLLPVVRTVIDSLFQFNSVGAEAEFVGLNNYADLLTSPESLTALRNNALWIIFGTPVALCIGMLVAVLADGRRLERFTKTIIFMPMAISLVGSGVIWGIVYTFQPTGETQTGLLNAVVVGLGGEPQAWITGLAPWNNFFLMVISIWAGTGFAMVFFSAALRGIPRELIEAAEVDGAGAMRRFFSIQLPYIWPAILAITTLSVIANLKIFDVVQVLTGGGFDTEVLATAFFRAQYEVINFGLAATYAVVLLVLVTPVMVYNVRQFRFNEGINPGGTSMLRRALNKLMLRHKVKSAG